MTPIQAVNEVKKLAKAEGISVSEYCVKRGVSPGTITRWRKYGPKTCTIETMRKLGLDV
jgi:hypothetical protein